jgi:hypothetical protein
MLSADARTEVFRRAACIVFTMQQLLMLMPMFRSSPLAAWVSGALPATVATLLVLAGARKRNAAVLIAAAAMFVAAVVFNTVVSDYSKRLLGTRSVMSLEWWCSDD